MKTRLKSVLILTLTMILTLSLNQVYALESKDMDSSYNIVELVQEDLEKQNTTILDQLNEQLQNYKYLLNSEKNEERKLQLKELILNTEIIIQDFNESQSDKARTVIQVPFAAEVGAVIAYFNAKGYKLSSELLTHARNNKTVDSSYTPYYGYHVQASPVFRKIANGTSTKGSATFPNSSSNTKIADCYYAIHKFNYTKSSSSSNIVRITDRYDFAPGDYNGIANIAVNAMYNAQLYGTIKPFYTKITCSND